MEVKLADEWASPIDSPFGLKTTGRLCIALFYNKLSSCIRKGIHNKERMLETLEAHVEQYEEAIPELEWAISTYKSLATTVNTEELCQDQQS
jgi:hypothetical protein